MFILSFKTGSAAFDDDGDLYYAEVQRILRKVADECEGRTGGIIHDVNGNHAGQWEVREPTDDEMSVDEVENQRRGSW